MSHRLKTTDQTENCQLMQVASSKAQAALRHTTPLRLWLSILTHLFTALFQPVDRPRTLFLQASCRHDQEARFSTSHCALYHAPAAARGKGMASAAAAPGKQHLLRLLSNVAHLVIVCLSQARLHRTGRTMAGVGRHAKHGHPSGGWRRRRRRHTSRTGKWRPPRGLGSRLGQGWWPVRPEYRPRCDALASKGNEGAQSLLLLAAVKTRCATRSGNDEVTLRSQRAAIKRRIFGCPLQSAGFGCKSFLRHLRTPQDSDLRRDSPPQLAAARQGFERRYAVAAGAVDSSDTIGAPASHLGCGHKPGSGGCRFCRPPDAADARARLRPALTACLHCPAAPCPCSDGWPLARWQGGGCRSRKWMCCRRTPPT